MSNTSFPFRNMLLLSARFSQSHPTSCSSLMFYHWVSNKCDRVKGHHWRWLIYAPSNFLLPNNMFSEATTRKTPLWSLFFLKMMKLDKEICSAWINRTSADILFLTDRRHKRLKNTIDLLLLYGQHLYGFSEGDLWKCKRQKHLFHKKHIHIHRSQTFWSFIKFYIVHIAKVCSVFKKQSLCLYSSVYA